MKFIAHLVNQQVAHEIIALELLTVLLEKPTDDSVEVAVGFVTECGSILQDLSPKGLHGGYSLELRGNNVLAFFSCKCDPNIAVSLFSNFLLHFMLHHESLSFCWLVLTILSKAG